ncbi:MAG: BrnA antitoxin family protein [Bdellovibrionales bacterium]
MKDVVTGKISKARKAKGTDWRALRSKPDSEIRSGIVNDPDARLTDEAFWKKAKVVMPKPKQTVTMRIDEDLLRWFRAQSGYQTRINAILRAYMEAEKGRDARDYR